MTKKYLIQKPEYLTKVPETNLVKYVPNHDSLLEIKL